MKDLPQISLPFPSKKAILEQSIPYLPINSQEKESSPPFLQDEKLQVTLEGSFALPLRF